MARSASTKSATCINPAKMRYRVAFQMVTRGRQLRNDIVEAFIEDMNAAHAVVGEAPVSR